MQTLQNGDGHIHAAQAPRSSADEANVAARQVAGVYAKALFNAAEKAGQTETVLEELDAFVEQVLEKHERIRDSLTSRIIGVDEKVAVLDKALSGRVSPLTANFLKVLARHDRLDAIEATRNQLRLLLDKARGRIEVELVTAAPIDSRLQARIAEKLRATIGGEPRLVHSVDPSLIGGIVLRIEDTVYDGSVATRLARLRAQMINRSVHEIQSRRDRFGYPAGN